MFALLTLKGTMAHCAANNETDRSLATCSVLHTDEAIAVSVSNRTPWGFTLTFGGSPMAQVSVNLLVTTSTENDPANPVNFSNVKEQQFGISDNPYTVTGLDANTLYHVYAQEDGETGWTHVTVSTPAACAKPENVSLNAQTRTLSWDGLGMSNWNIKVSTTALTNPTTSTANIMNNGTSSVPYIDIPNLQDGNTYHFYVQADCDNGALSEWAYYSLNMSYCTPTGIAGQMFLTSITTTGAVQDINKEVTTTPNSTNSNYTSIQCIQNAGDTIHITIKGNNTGPTKGYVDWNCNYVFADEEMVFSATTSSSTYTAEADIAVPANVPAGNYRLRVLLGFMGTVGPCSVGALGDSHDYTIVVLSASECLPPSDLAHSNITSGSATLNWTASISEPAFGYDLYYSKNNTAPDANTYPSQTETGVTADISDLDHTTTYYVWVRSNCGGGDYSIWVGPHTFTTAPVCFSPEDVAVPVSTVTPTTATVAWSVIPGAVNYTIEYGLAANFPTGSTTVTTTGNVPEKVLQGLTPKTAYTLRIKTNCGTDGSSLWTTINFFTPATETSGNGIWHGYVYQSNAPGLWGQYIGYVEEPIKINRTVEKNGYPWTGNNPQWVNGSGPTHYFAVRYKTTYNFPCGYYAITFSEITTAVRLSVDGGTTWLDLCYGNNCGTGVAWDNVDVVADNLRTYTAKAYLSGSTNLVLEYFNGERAPKLTFNYAVEGPGISFANDTPTAVDVTINGGDQWQLKVATGMINPKTTNGDVLNTTVSAVPYPLTGLTPETTYHLYARISCDTFWTYTTYTTMESCPAPANLKSYNIWSNAATLSWSEFGQTGWNIKVSETPLSDPGSQAPVGGVEASPTQASYTATGLSAATTYYWYVQSNCGSAWASGTFTTTRCPEEDACSYYLHIGAIPGGMFNIGWGNGGYVRVKQDGALLYAYEHPNGTTDMPGIDAVLHLCKNKHTEIEFYCAAKEPAKNGGGYFSLKNSNDEEIYYSDLASEVYHSPEFVILDNCSLCEPPQVTTVNTTSTSFSIAFPDDNPHDIKVSTVEIDPETEYGDVIYSEEGTTLNPYPVTDLETQQSFYVYVRESGACWSGANIMGTAAEEVYGEGEWNGYVYTAAGSAGAWSKGNYRGFVTEPATFTRNTGTAAWTGSTEQWASAPPADNFVVHYKMKKEFLCGFYTFTIGTDDHVKLTVNDSLLSNWTTDNKAHTLSPIFLEGETYLDFEFHEATGDAIAQVSYKVQPTGITITDIDGYSAKVNFVGGNYWSLKVATDTIDPETQDGNVSGYENLSAPGNPASITGLLPETTYYVYVSSDCNSDWAAVDFTTAVTCPAVKNITATSLTETGARFSWTAGSTETSWSVVYGSPDDDPKNLTPEAISDDPVFEISDGTLTGNTQYALWIKAHCGGIDNSRWVQKLFKTQCGTVSATYIGYAESAGWTGTTVPPDSAAGSFHGLQGPGMLGDCRATALVPDCWDISASCLYGTSGARYPRVELNPNTSYAIMPNLSNSVNMSDLRMKIWIRSDAESKGLDVFVTQGNNLTGIEKLTTIGGGYNSTFPDKEEYVMREIDLGALYTAAGATGRRVGFVPSGEHRVDIYKVVIWHYIPPTCPVPTTLTVTNKSANHATIAWTAGGNETEWKLAYRTAEESAWTAYPTTITGTPTANLTNLTADTYYEVRVKSICSANDESEWNTISFWTSQTVCNAPENVHGTAEPTAIEVAWTAKNSETTWRIDYGTGSPLTVNTNPYTLTGLTPNTTYRVCVTALCATDAESEATCADLSTPLSVKDLEWANAVNIFPNPADNKLTITATIPLQSIEITDLMGQVLARIAVNRDDKIEINITDYAAGFYFVRLCSNDGYITKKFMKR